MSCPGFTGAAALPFLAGAGAGAEAAALRFGGMIYSAPHTHNKAATASERNDAVLAREEGVAKEVAR